MMFASVLTALRMEKQLWLAALSCFSELQFLPQFLKFHIPQLLSSISS